jgi:hypothetical protein
MKDFLLTLVLQGLEEKYEVRLSRGMKVVRYKFSEAKILCTKFFGALNFGILSALIQL